MTTKQETAKIAKQTASIKSTRIEMERELAELDRKEAADKKAHEAAVIIDSMLGL